MPLTASRIRLTDEGATLLVEAAAAKARAMGQPQCIAVVDEGCNLLAYLRMDGAKLLSRESAIRKAMTAASGRVPTGQLAEGLDARLALATDGRVTNLQGGLPIVLHGQVVGGIGIGSGTGAQDAEVAEAALAALVRAAG
ncbi:GlcG/HbpS family heme-binding protein [Pseudorhodoferax sp.]|uniref:GlcG/HbpS family heme-binding protein n=1 Tax=Pseudorhodoferax sp. TaxID=1993553 RepID=UPI0039E374C2